MLPARPDRQTDLEGRRENLNRANKLSRTYSTLLEMLNRHRGKGQQKVTVEHVHVHAGGQRWCTISANGDAEVGRFLAEAMKKAKSLEMELDVVEGMQFDRGYISPYFITNEVKERKDRVDDAMHATRAAVEEGILPGGGVALLRAIKAIEKVKTQNEDQKHGVEIVRKALSWPARQIVIKCRRGRLGCSRKNPRKG